MWRRRIVPIIGAVVFIALAWIIWPYYALYDLSVALRDGDTAALENRIAWDSVRRSLRNDLNAMLLQQLANDGGGNAGAGLATLLGPVVINQMVESYLTPQAVGNLIRSGRAAVQDKPKTAAKTATEPSREFDLKKVRYAFFSGGPLAFKVELNPDDDISSEDVLTLLLRWSGDWRLTRIILPPVSASKEMEKVSKPQEPSPVEVELLHKELQSGEIFSEIVFLLSMKNVTQKDIRAFDGRLVFTDLLDNEIYSASLAINDPIAANTVLKQHKSIRYNQFRKDHRKFLNEADANIKTVFVTEKVLFADGTTKDYGK